MTGTVISISSPSELTPAMYRKSLRNILFSGLFFLFFWLDIHSITFSKLQSPSSVSSGISYSSSVHAKFTLG